MCVPSQATIANYSSLMIREPHQNNQTQKRWTMIRVHENNRDIDFILFHSNEGCSKAAKVAMSHKGVTHCDSIRRFPYKRTLQARIMKFMYIQQERCSSKRSKTPRPKDTKALKDTKAQGHQSAQRHQGPRTSKRSKTPRPKDIKALKDIKEHWRHPKKSGQHQYQYQQQHQQYQHD